LLKGYYQNVRGLHTKLNILICNISLFRFDYFVLVETWLNSYILDAELGFDCYNVFRLDRIDKTSNSTRGGGVAIFVNKRFEAETINIQHDSVEQLFVLIKWGNNDKCIIGSCYIPLHSPLNSDTVSTY